MRLLFLTLFFCLCLAATCRAESFMQGLGNINEGLNNLNQGILDSLDGDSGNGSYEAQMARYRRLEAARVREMSEVTGVDPNVIRRMRQNGATWEEIAAKYNVNLDNLPSPQINQ